MQILIWILLILAACYLAAILPSLRRCPDMKRLQAVRYAHRGLFDNSGSSPENSLSAFQKAADAGYGIELDVQLTSDGVPVVFHDFRLGRVVRNSDGSPVSGKVSDYTLDQLQQFHLMNSQEKIPTFAKVLQLIHGRVPMIMELKIESSDRTLAVCPAADALLQQYPGLYCMESFNPRGVRWYRRTRPEIIRGQLSDEFNREDPDHRSLLNFACANLLFNFLTRPDFIAYNVSYPHNLSRLLCRNLYHCTAVAWTIRSDQQMAEAEKQFDVFIFDSFVPAGGPAARA